MFLTVDRVMKTHKSQDAKTGTFSDFYPSTIKNDWSLFYSNFNFIILFLGG